MIIINKIHSVTNSHSLYHRQSLLIREKNYTWTLTNLPLFDELIISWNALRPLKGHYVILSCVQIENEWSPWLLYAVWGENHQYSFHDTTGKAPVHSFQDQVQILDGKLATGFSIRLEAHAGANLGGFYDLYACTSRLNEIKAYQEFSLDASISLAVPNLSQFSLNHPRSRSLCSPTSTTAVIQHLQSDRRLNPLKFSKQVYDAAFDIYGHWPFNIAQAFVELGREWQCFCARINSQWLWKSLEAGFPVVISVKGTLPGAFIPYSNGHLLVIKGYDVLTQQFLCMDPAFPSDEETEIAYSYSVLMEAWQKRSYLAYLFFPRYAFICKLFLLSPREHD